jgi:hypothetical protein
VVDTVASWVKKGFVAGPFDYPPLPQFRVNPLMAVDQGEKVRLVLNVSAPKGSSFNDNVVQEGIEKVTMSSARAVSHIIVDAGVNAVMSKLDKKDAYKLIPAKTKDLRLQGFSLLGKFFVETQQIFGSQKAVENFDRLGNTIHRISVIESGIDPATAPRQLDDVVCVSPAKSDNCKRFTDVFMKNCKELNVPLADFCPKFEKAFYCSNYGKVLGVQFNTSTLCWKLPDEKIEKTLEAISHAYKSKTMDLQSMQSLMGRLNNVSIMCPFLNGFKKPLNETLGHLQRSGGQIPLTDQGKKDLLVWAGFLLDTEKWNPISPRPAAPTIRRLEFTSDAAGAGNSGSGRIGCGNVGLNSRGEIFFATQIFWDRENFLEKTDGKGSRLKTKPQR